MQNHTRSSYQDGLFAEFMARMYLRIHGFRILQSRFVTGRNTGRAEIDIIARRGNLMIFIEVKKRKTAESAFDAISFSQIQRLRRAAENYISKTRWRGETRFDVIAVIGKRIQWFKGAI